MPVASEYEPLRHAWQVIGEVPAVRNPRRMVNNWNTSETGGAMTGWVQQETSVGEVSLRFPGPGFREKRSIIGQAKEGNPHGAKPCTRYSMSHLPSLRNCLPSTPCRHHDALPHSSTRGATGTTQPVHERVGAKNGQQAAHAAHQFSVPQGALQADTAAVSEYEP